MRSHIYINKSIICLFVLTFWGAAAANAATYYVDSGRADDTGDGLSWGTAKKTVQAAITVAVSSDQVWVKKGTYTEAITMKSGVGLYGGFAGTESSVWGRTAGNTTMIDATTATPRYHVVTMDSLVNTRVDWFTIMGGAANGGASPNNVGAGIYCNNLNNTNIIINCTIKTNVAAADGSGAFCGGGSAPVIASCVFSGNVSTTAGTRGGGLHCDASSPTVTGCIFLSNYAVNGAAVACSGAAAPVFTNCGLLANTAITLGGGIYATASTPTFTNCTISGNATYGTAPTTGRTGGGVYCLTAPAVFTNCVFSGNSSGDGGAGGLYFQSCSPTLVNCVVSSNSTTGNGGGILFKTATAPILKNTIFENNAKYAVYELDATCGSIITYCLFYTNPNGDYFYKGATAYNGTNINTVSGDNNNVATDPKLIMNGATAISGTWTAAGTYSAATTLTTLTNSAATFTPGALAGRMINANVTQRNQAYILTNTATVIYVLGNVSSYATLGATYRIADYHLASGSGAIDYGTSAGAPATDMDGNPRGIDIPGVGGTGLTYDIGAYEEVPYVAYVDNARTDDTGDGLTWATAKKTIQAAIDLSTVVHEVWVKTGTYNQTITLKTGVFLFGGFAGTEQTLAQRNASAYPVTINAASASPRFHVVTMDGITNGRMDGFTIVGGSASGTGTSQYGGGIYANNLDNTITIANCVISLNIAVEGSGIYCAASSPVIANCTLTGNYASTYGTLLCNSGSAPAITGCRIVANSVTGTNAGGAGVWCLAASAPTLASCVISGNSTSGTNVDGGGLGCNASSPVLNQCIVSGNLTNRSGGGVICLAASAPTFTNCLVTGNSALNGGGVYCDASAPIFINCNVASNTASASGGGIYCGNGSNPSLGNTLFENNPAIAVFEADTNSDPVVTDCLFYNNPDGDYRDEGTTTLTGAAAINGLAGNSGNVSGDPKFVMNGSFAAQGAWTAAPTYSSSSFQTTLTNTGASYTVNALAGKLINANTGQRRQAYILNNSATTIAVEGDVTSYVSSGNSYAIVDYHLSDLSAAVDTGGAVVGVPATDIESKPRPADILGQGADGTGTEYDIGAYEAQTFPPAVRSITRVGASPTNAASVQFLVTFSKPVTGVVAGDFSVTVSGVTGAAVASVSADTGATRTVTVTTGNGTGTLRLDVVDNDTIIDANLAPLGGPGAGNGNFTTGDTYAFDNVKPTPVISGAATLTNATRTLTIAFGKDVTGFALPGGVTVTNGTASNLQPVGGIPGSFTVDILGSGTVTVSVFVPAGAATDDAGNASNAMASPFTYAFDNVRPTPVITGATTLTNTTRTLTIAFGEDVTGFALPDGIVVTSGIASNLQPVSGTPGSFTVDIMGSGDVTVSVYVPGSVAADDATNPNNPATAPFAFPFDNVPPTPVITGLSTLTNTTRTLTVDFGEPINGFNLSSVSVTNGTASNVQPSGYASSYTVDILGSGTNTVSVSVLANATTDNAGNPSNASVTPFTYPFDNVPPAPIITGATTLTNTTRTLAVAFGKNVSGFALPGGIAVMNGTASNLQPVAGNPGSFTVDVLGSGTVTVSVSIPAGAATDDAGNASTASGAPFAYPFDDVKPTPVITGATTPANTTRTLTVAFGENVSGFALPGGLTVLNGTATNLQPVNGIPGSYTLDVLGSGVATVSVAIPAGAATDDAGNASNATSVPFTYSFDNVKPTPAITGTTTLTNAPRTLTIAFGEDVTGFVLPGGIAVVNGTATNLQPMTGAPGSFTVDIDGAGSATVSVSIPAGAAVDDAGNSSNATDAPFTFPFDNVKPTPVITGATTVTNAPRTLTVAFGENVTGFALSDVVVANGAASNLQAVAGTPGGFTLDVQGDGDATVSVSILADAAADDAGNSSNATSAPFMFPFDNVAPTAEITLAGTTRTTADAVAFYVNFSETVNFSGAAVSLATGSLAGEIAATGTGPDYTVTVTLDDPNADGSVGISVSGATVADLAGNPYAGDHSSFYAIHNWHGFTTQPANSKAYTDDSLSFAVDADFAPITPTFQWKWDDAAKAIHDGPTTQTWAIDHATTADNGSYWCLATYDGAVHESAHAALAVEDHLQLTNDPVGGKGIVGGTFTFAVLATGGFPPLTYTWKKAGIPIAGATDSSYTISPIAPASAAIYTVDVADAYADLESRSAELTVTGGMPVAGAAGLAILLGVMCITGVTRARKK